MSLFPLTPSPSISLLLLFPFDLVCQDIKKNPRDQNELMVRRSADRNQSERYVTPRLADSLFLLVRLTEPDGLVRRDSGGGGGGG